MATNQSVKELEQKAIALLDQCLTDLDKKTGLSELQAILKQLPPDKCSYERGIVAFRIEIFSKL